MSHSPPVPGFTEPTPVEIAHRLVQILSSTCQVVSQSLTHKVTEKRGLILAHTERKLGP